MSHCTEKNDDGAVADGKGENEQHRADEIGLRPRKGKAEHRGDVGKRTRSERDAERQPQQQGGEQAAFLCGTGTERPVRTNDIEKVQTDDEKYDGHGDIARLAQITHQSAERCREDADERDGDQDARGKNRGQDKRSAGGLFFLLHDKADDERDARQMARAQQDAEHAPGEGSGQRQPETRRHRGVQRGEKRFDHDVVLGLSPCFCKKASISFSGKKPSWRMISLPP